MVPRPGASGKVKAEKNAPGSLVPPRPKLPATKSTPPRPEARASVPRPTPSTPAPPPAPEPKVEPVVEEEIALEAADVVEEKAPEPEPIALEAADVVEEREPEPPQVVVPAPPPMPRIDARPAMRSLAPSLPSQYELDSIRKSSPPVLARRRQLQKLVASAVGIAWFICLAALGQSALRSLLASVAGR